MTQKVKAFVTHRFPLWHPSDFVNINTSPREVSLTPWLQAQIDAGLIGVVGEQPATEPEPKEPKSKPKKSESEDK